MGKGACGVAPHQAELKRNPGFLASLKDVTSFSSKSGEAEAAEKERILQARQSMKAKKGEKTEFTWEEVEEHKHKYDCWIVIKGNVYDVTEFAPTHPGGRAIYSLGGRDASDTFTAFHEPRTWSRLKEFKIGTVTEPDAKSTAVIKDFREMRNKMVADGLFETSIPYYMWKVISTWGIYVAAAVVMNSFADSVLGYLTSAMLLGLFWQQSGWLCHDFCHNQVFKNRKLNARFAFLLGPISQGFSVDWWNNKHNTHHAVPNEIAGDTPVDPDIDTLPFIAWDMEMLRDASPTIRKIVSKQHYLVGPILFLARMSWATQSFLNAVAITSIKETSGILAHYALMMAIPMYAGYSLLGAVGYLMVAQLFGGWFLGFVFMQSHNAMEVYDGEMDFASAQLVSTRNIHFGPLNDWFAGGLNMQIEHHLFPTMPRHNLRKAARQVEELCGRHGLVYENVGWCSATCKVIARLHDIAKQAHVVKAE
uniref:Cytochrome b5 heme-binding domain-containing protein n=1 Tax=Pyramimonas obovata TaxID=1411642 RepID=A0A7S0RZB0_9CHLO|mmetsp:Transcript_8852/g.18352  ORF Transcript_8852/g.18352 Transcript_8852/m.18352 type:complete len:478 (+) Transcript_8852:312-1745(+)|eukprot:CAMPEP_0118933468 /NCGR_PEP_ID=MMETSP1169-20130426/12005_1 /TAXON_ID=36882 /ORGANISM="Pyramimonas obovata, Strain CCMP722" /LENGTH=477 /DNA_ID=CAMNT_0006876229 /DNA_START=312 /DNA_END=1745 /DNA_ORIENTATION=-